MKPETIMNGRVKLFLIVFILVLVLGPAYCLPCDDILQLNPTVCDAYYQPYISTGAVFDFNHKQFLIGNSLFWDIFFHLPQNIPLSRGNRAPPV
jgi:hypothetical protein